MNFSFAAKQAWGNHVFSYSSQIRGFNLFMIWLLAWNLGHAWLQSTVSQLSFKFGIQYELSSCQRLLWDEPVFCGFGDVISSSSFGFWIHLRAWIHLLIGANVGPGCWWDLETQGNLLLTSVSGQQVLTKSFSQCDGKVFVSRTDIATSV